MPPLEKKVERKTTILPPRKAIMAAHAEVLVVGGGPAGLAAACGAADAGANVILAERYGYLGGNATAALVMPMASSHTYNPPAATASPAFSLAPSDVGPGRKIIGGVYQRFIEELVRANGAIPPMHETGFVVPFDPEVFKSVALDLLDKAHVSYLLHAFATDCFHENNVWKVVFETKSGPVVISADVVVDCTGDGDIAAAVGAKYEIGREDDGLVQPMSLLFRIAQFSKQAFANYVKEHPDQWKGVYGLWDLVKKASQDGELDLPRENILFFGMPHENEIIVNSTRVIKVLGTDVWDLTYAEWQSRKQMKQIAAFLKKYVPGFEKSYAVQSGVIGVRESRRIIGEYRLTEEDILSAKKFDDMIACGSYPLDIHNPKGKGTVLERIPQDQSYSIPLRCLIPKKTQQMLVAGRCISATHQALSSFRVMPICMATGHAAGVCAALSLHLNKPPRDIPASLVQDELLRQGAILDR